MQAIRFLCVLTITSLVCSVRAADAAPPPDDATTSETKPRQPREVVEDVVAKVMTILKDPVYKEPGKKMAMREKIQFSLLSSVDIKTVCSLTLANYRKNFSEEQFKKFSDLFSRLLFSTYISHLEKHTNEKVVTLEVKNLSGSRALVKTKTLTDTKDIPIDFSLIKQGNKWLLYDVHIEGVSLVVNYRSQFREILLNHSPAQFLERLEEKVKENEKNL